MLKRASWHCSFFSWFCRCQSSCLARPSTNCDAPSRRQPDLRGLFSALEAKEQLLKLLEAADAAEGVQIFIGAENELFGLAGCSAVISPYRDSQRRLIGAVGVIGPSRINYARIIPMVDYTAKVIGRILG